MLFAVVSCLSQAACCLATEGVAEALQSLRSAKEGPDGQAAIRRAWKVVSSANVAELPDILQAMKDASPLAENWLRAAVDTIAERELRESGGLPAKVLEQFVLDRNESPRARRAAFEWLVHVDESASDRLMREMLDDSSLELRFDAVEKLIGEAEQTADKQLKLERFRRAFESARDMAQSIRCAEALKSLGEAPQLAEHFGYVTKWMVIGPFDNTGGEGFEKAYPPEQEVNFSKSYQGKHVEVSWREHQTTAEAPEDLGLVDLNEVLAEEKDVVAYAAIKFVSARELELQCRYESVNATKIWVNGEALASHPAYHAGDAFDQHIVPVRFREGENTILLKVCQNEQTEAWARPWVFQFRVADGLGGGSLGLLQLR